MWLLWDWMGIDHWEFHGMVLWVMQWDSMDLHWVLLIGNSTPKCSMAMPLGCPDGAPMELHWYCSIGAPWKCLMGNALGIHICGFSVNGWGLLIGASMELFFWVMHWDAMDMHWGCSLGMPWMCFIGRSLGCPHVTPMELSGYCSIRSTMEVPYG